MKTKLTRIHLGLGMPEIGVQFDTLDDSDQKTSTQRAFVVVPDEVLAPVWAAAQIALDAALAQLPLDMPPGNVTTALMQQRTAEHAAQAARDAEREARAAEAAAHERRAKAESEAAAHEDAIARARAELEAIRAERDAHARAAIAAAEAESAKPA